jgi:hypothetical protein
MSPMLNTPIVADKGPSIDYYTVDDDFGVYIGMKCHFPTCEDFLKAVNSKLSDCGNVIYLSDVESVHAVKTEDGYETRSEQGSDTIVRFSCEHRTKEYLETFCITEYILFCPYCGKRIEKEKIKTPKGGRP